MFLQLLTSSFPAYPLYLALYGITHNKIMLSIPRTRNVVFATVKEIDGSNLKILSLIFFLVAIGGIFLVTKISVDWEETKNKSLDKKTAYLKYGAWTLLFQLFYIVAYAALGQSMNPW